MMRILIPGNIYVSAATPRAGNVYFFIRYDKGCYVFLCGKKFFNYYFVDDMMKKVT